MESIEDSTNQPQWTEAPKTPPAVILGQRLLEKYRILTLRDTYEIYIYNPETGIYQPNGETRLKEYASEVLGEYYKSNTIMEAIKLVQSRTCIDREELGLPPHHIALKNGILNLKTRELYPPSPIFKAITKLPAEYHPDVKCTHFARYLESIRLSPRDQRLLQEYVGYCLDRSLAYKMALLLVGPHDVGKTTLLRAIIALLGEKNVTALSLIDLEERFMLAELYGKVANVHDDLSHEELKKIGKFKQITGDSLITAQRKFTDPFHFTNEAKPIFATNNIPKAPDSYDNAFYERWRIIHMNHVFKPEEMDRQLRDRLASPEELTGILNWALEGLGRLEAREYFESHQTTAQVKAEFGWIDSVELFLGADAEFDPTSVISKNELYDGYVKFCKDQGYAVLERDTFCGRVSKSPRVLPARLGSEDRIQAFRGIKLRQ
jgi:putative DNA primase/helicase